MKFKFFLVLLLVSLSFSKCSKNQEDPTKMCFQAKYIGEACGGPMVQVLTNLPDLHITAVYEVGNLTYDQALEVNEVPESSRSGKPFFFTVSSIDSNTVFNTNCTSFKYHAVTSSFSDSACQTRDSE